MKLPPRPALSLCTLALCAFSQFVTAENAPRDWENIRMVLPGNYQDPAILRVGADYYMTHSNNEYTPSLLVWHSRDLIHWEPLDYAVKEPVGGIWSPDIVKYKELFYIYYPSNGGIHVVTARNPAGPWSAPVDLHIANIDPGHVVDDNGERYLGLSGGNLIALAEDGLSTAGPSRHIYDGWPTPWDPNRFSGEGQWLEGPKFFRHGGYLYLVSAENGTAGPPTSHMLIVARAKTLDGPWENCPNNPIVHTASRDEPWWSRGHGTIFDTPDGRWYVLYHGYRHELTTLGRFSLLEPIVWTTDGWPAVPSTKLADDPVLAAPAVPTPPFADDFKGPALGLPWQFFDAAPASLRLDNGLAVSSREVGMEQGMFLTYNQGEASYQVETAVSTTENAQGGLVFFYNRKHFAGLVLEHDGLHYVRDNASRKLIAEAKGSPLELRLVNTHNAVDMYYRMNEGGWKKVEPSYDLSGYDNSMFGGFDSLRPALTASGTGETRFTRFSYTPLQPSR